MKLYIFRHGQTDYNLQNIVQGAGIDAPLNDTGKQQAQELQSQLSPKGLQKIYCSPLQRAQETANTVAQNKIEVEPLWGLEEVHYGEVEGLNSKVLHEKYGEIYQIIHDDNNPLNMDTCFPKGETKRQSTERGVKALEYIKEHCLYDIVGVATHGALMFNLYKYYYQQNRSFTNCDWFELEL